MAKWAAAEYPGSLFFTSLTADMEAVFRRDVATARAMQEREATEMSRLPALLYVLNYKRGLYALTDRDWLRAGRYFKVSTDVFVAAKRRSMVPFMCAYSFLCCAQAEIEAGARQDAAGLAVARAESVAALTMLAQYRAMGKKNWGRQDEWAFQMLKHFRELPQYKDALPAAATPGGLLGGLLNLRVLKKDEPPATDRWILLELVEIMIMQVRVVFWMTPDALAALQQQLAKELGLRRSASADERARVAVCDIELFRQMGDAKAASAAYHKAMALQPKLSAAGVQGGTLALAEYYAAVAAFEQGDVGATKLHLQGVKRRGTKHDLYAVLLLKTSVLMRSVGEGLEQDFEQVDLAAGQSVTLVVTVPAKKDVEEMLLASGGSPAAIGDAKPATLRWFWLVDSHSVDFRAEFRAAGAATSKLLQVADRKEATDDAMSGELIVGGDLQGGELRLMWDNSFSVLRSKTVRYRVAGWAGLETYWDSDKTARADSKGGQLE